MSPQKVRTAVFPVAGIGTRFLPVTKSVPKELLPVIDRPLIQYAMDECRAAGIERMVFVTHPSKEAIRNYVLQNADLSETLRRRGKSEEADLLEGLALNEDEDAMFAEQLEPLGLGHAVYCAKPFVLDGPVAVILPDDLILGEPGCLTEMIEAYEAIDVGHLVAVMEVPRNEVSKYGILSVTSPRGSLVLADGMIEKPQPDDAPSRTAVVGRYILDASIFEMLETQEPGAGGEIQLTDAIVRGIDSAGLAGFHFSGERFDCGSKEGMLAATLRVVGQTPQYANVLETFATEYRTRNPAPLGAQ